MVGPHTRSVIRRRPDPHNICQADGTAEGTCKSLFPGTFVLPKPGLWPFLLVQSNARLRRVRLHWPVSSIDNGLKPMGAPRRGA